MILILNLCLIMSCPGYGDKDAQCWVHAIPLIFVQLHEWIGLVWLCLCWSYWHFHYGKYTDNRSPLSKFFHTSCFKLWKLHAKKSNVIWFCSTVYTQNPNICSFQFTYMGNLGEQLVQSKLTSHSNLLSLCLIFRSQMALEPYLALHNFFYFSSTGMHLQ